MKTLLVICHPRRDSLTAAVADAFAAHAPDIAFERADLYAEGFDPRLGLEDEPDWENPRKRYSLEVRREMARVERNEATVMVFPVWWWSVPAMLKGWIDRVWNNGWAYGGAVYPHRRAWMIGVCGSDAAAFAARGYDTAIRTQLDIGVLDYCGVPERRVELLYGVNDGGAAIERILADAARLGSEFAA